MARPCFLTHLVLVSFFLFLLFSHGTTDGFGRTLKSSVQDDEVSSVGVEETGGNSREMIEVMDYGDPVANTNPRGVVFSPPPK